ncbi:DUF3310 domain-containing protein [Natronospira bacteriovora]|uniref:DUF3310 domain-containing protein n=1 Tax=Natronospira bacteriovora TaxID=3069753 RepID=A0ABU0W5I3_9GAMM|nr:DUF3310 domain-containing protein [Natronospira sp. AB-CW4]MDQ2069288.1 DUF3310 domain-containing protein [Natronospira sp. AB-CW4]
MSIRQQPHYAHGIQPLEYMESRFNQKEMRGFLAGNVIKYVSRFALKDGVKDLQKALDYLERLIRHEGGCPDSDRTADFKRFKDAHPLAPGIYICGLTNGGLAPAFWNGKQFSGDLPVGVTVSCFLPVRLHSAPDLAAKGARHD